MYLEPPSKKGLLAQKAFFLTFTGAPFSMNDGWLLKNADRTPKACRGRKSVARRVHTLARGEKWRFRRRNARGEIEMLCYGSEISCEGNETFC